MPRARGPLNGSTLEGGAYSACALAAAGGYIMADDVSASFPAVTGAWRAAVDDEGVIEQIECVAHPVKVEGRNKGWCLGSFKNPRA